MKKDKTPKQKRQFSKSLLIQESALIWVTTIMILIMAFYCIVNENFGDLPWLTAMVGFPWTAYAVSQMYYYKKSEKENTVGGVKYESVMAEIAKMKEYREQVSEDYMELTYSGSEEPSNPEEGVG
jgi:hypothetical protein